MTIMDGDSDGVVVVMALVVVLVMMAFVVK